MRNLKEIKEYYNNLLESPEFKKGTYLGYDDLGYKMVSVLQNGEIQAEWFRTENGDWLQV